MATSVRSDAEGTDRGRRLRLHGAFTWRMYAVIFGAMAAVAVVVIGLAIWVSTRVDGDLARPEVIQLVLPPEGGAMMRQDRVGVTLEQGYGCVLVIDGIRIPEGQYSGVAELGECYFQVGPEKMIEEFAPGRHTVTVTVFPQGRPAEAQTYAWSFQTQ